MQWTVLAKNKQVKENGKNIKECAKKEGRYLLLG